ncbi:MAG: glycosyltransferase family 1 protein [Chloroflexota bacterium]
MRIAIDARLTYYSQAGISRYIKQLLASAPSIDPDHDWFAVRMRKDSSKCIINSIDVYTPSHNKVESWALGIELLGHRLDLFHATDFIPPRFGARRMVITVHDLNFIHFPQFLTRESLRYYGGNIRRAAATADHIIADSECTSQDLQEMLAVPADKITTIHLAVDSAFRTIDDIDPMLNNLQLDQGYILFVGTIEPRKNIPALLKAYHRLLGENNSLPLLAIVGRKGWLSEPIFETISSLKLEGQVRVLDDVVTTNELVALYNGASMLVLPSFYEGFGLPALEAMSCGTPVIVSNAGSLPEIVGEAGILVDPKDIDGLADAISRVLSDTELASRLSALGLERAAKFSWNDTARQTLQVYHKVLSR